MTTISSVSSAGIYNVTNQTIGLDITRLNHSDSDIGNAYQSLISQEAYEKFKQTHEQEIEDLAKNMEKSDKETKIVSLGGVREYAKKIASTKPMKMSSGDQHLQILHQERSGSSITLGLNANSVAQFRQKFMEENLSSNAKAMIEKLQKNSGMQVVSQLKNSEVSLNTQEKICVVGADLLEFMADHQGSQAVWDGIATGKYSNLDEVDTALKFAGKTDTARELKKSASGQNVDAEVIRASITADIEMFDLGNFSLNYQERAARKAYANSILTDDVIKKYQNYYHAQQEQNIPELYQKGFYTAASLRDNF